MWSIDPMECMAPIAWSMEPIELMDVDMATCSVPGPDGEPHSR